jgi:hypothetical protein
MLDRTKLAAEIREDLLAEKEAPAGTLKEGEPTKCFLCRASFIYRRATGDASGRFCSDRCRDAHDAGARYKSTTIRYLDRLGKPMQATRNGFLINCKCCSRQFESLGYAYCSKECGRTSRDRKEAETVAAEIGHKPQASRICEAPGCGQRIPRYTSTGKATAAKVRWCSPSHRKIVLEA